MSLLSASGVSVAYDSIPALSGVDIEVSSGEVVVVLGSNGAGKTSLMKTVLGLIRPAQGSIQFDGRQITGLPPHTIHSLGISWVPEGRRLWPSLTVRENLELAVFRLRDRREVERRIRRTEAMFPIIRERSHQAAGSLSGGEQQMVAIARAMMSEPRLILMDEPSLGLAPIVVQRVFGLIGEINATGVTVLLVEQNARKALDVADRAYLLEVGHVVSAGSARQMEDDGRVREVFLGG